MTAVTKNPTSDTSVTGTWTGSVGSRYTAVDDHPDSGGSDSLTCSAVGVLVMGFSAFSIPTGSTVQNVKLYYYDQKSGSPASAIGGLLRVNATNYSAATHNPANGTWTLRTDTWTTNPATSAAWTVADVNGTGSKPLQGFGVDVTDATPSVLLASILIEVNYTPPSSVAALLGNAI